MGSVFALRRRCRWCSEGVDKMDFRALLCALGVLCGGTSTIHVGTLALCPHYKHMSPRRRPGLTLSSPCQFDSLIIRPLADWIGRAFIGYSRAKIPICCDAMGTGFFITIHSTPSLHGGVVSEPM